MASLVKIPGGITVDHFVQVRKFLEQVLAELKARGTGAKRVVTRLNDSESSGPAPYFVGIIEDQDLVQERVRRNEPDAGLFRFGDDNPSKVYDETVSVPSGRIIERNWDRDRHEKKKGAQTLGHDIGCKHQRFIAIRIPLGSQHQHVGTITVGFEQDPGPQMAQIQAIMTKWAQDAHNSDFIKYLKDNFTLNGPKF